MMTDIQNLKLNPGDMIGNFTIKMKIREGSSGTIFLVNDRENEETKLAMKFESSIKFKGDFEKEILTLKRLQHSRHVCHLITYGKIENHHFFITTLLWKDLAELRRRMPERRMSLETTLKIGVQCLNLSLLFTSIY